MSTDSTVLGRHTRSLTPLQPVSHGLLASPCAPYRPAALGRRLDTLRHLAADVTADPYLGPAEQPTATKPQPTSTPRTDHPPPSHGYKTRGAHKAQQQALDQQGLEDDSYDDTQGQGHNQEGLYPQYTGHTAAGTDWDGSGSISDDCLSSDVSNGGAGDGEGREGEKDSGAGEGAWEAAARRGVRAWARRRLPMVAVSRELVPTNQATSTAAADAALEPGDAPVRARTPLAGEPTDTRPVQRQERSVSPQLPSCQHRETRNGTYSQQRARSGGLWVRMSVSDIESRLKDFR